MIRQGQEQRAAPQGGYGPPQGQAYGSQQGQPGYGGSQQQTYQGGHTTPGGAWPMTTPDSKVSSSSGGATALIALATAVLAAAVYAGWAFTARRGIFADFADGSSVSTDDAKSSDTVDMILLIVAGVIVLVALGLWITRLVADKTKGGGLDIGGLVVAVLGVVTVLVGLFLASGIADADGQTAQGDKGVTATLVVGGGFVLIAIGSMIGMSTVRGPSSSSRDSSHGSYQPGGPGYQSW